MISSAVVLLLLFDGGAVTGGVSLPRVVADARLAAAGPRGGRPAEARAALARLWELEAETARRWRDSPDGPQARLTALILAHTVIARVRLRGLIPDEDLEELDRRRARCHAATPDDPVSRSSAAFFDALRDHRPGLDFAFSKAPKTRAVVAAALARLRRPVVFDPAEPKFASGICSRRGERDIIRIAGRGDPSRRGTPLATAVYESFNSHNLRFSPKLEEDAASGRIDRGTFSRTIAALEELACVQKMAVLKRHYRELDEAGVAEEPRHWGVKTIPLFVPRNPGWHVPTRTFPHGYYGASYDRIRLRGQARPGGDLWEASVLLDRFWFHDPDRFDGRAALRRLGREITAIEWSDPWCVLHRHLPRPVRVWLSTVRGGERLAAFCRAGRAVAAAVRP